ncbi:hypothetical protein M569_05823, partial [Genlisea aurea]
MLAIVTVRCGHCSNLLSVNMGGGYQQVSEQQASMIQSSNRMIQSEPPPPPIRPPEKRQRVPSAYNRFIREEIQRIKASNPEISHREAFSTAAKNWAHFPHIHFGLENSGSKQRKAAAAGEAA